MKPLPKCPYCGSNFENIIQNSNWHEQICPLRCNMKYSQYFDGDFTSDKLQYIRFQTKNFYYYVYFEKGFYPNTVHFYSHKELEAHGKAMTILWGVPASRVPTDELEEIAKSRYETMSQTRAWLDKVDEKFHILALFS